LSHAHNDIAMEGIRAYKLRTRYQRKEGTHEKKSKE